MRPYAVWQCPDYQGSKQREKGWIGSDDGFQVRPR